MDATAGRRPPPAARGQRRCRFTSCPVSSKRRPRAHDRDVGAARSDATVRSNTRWHALPNAVDMRASAESAVGSGRGHTSARGSSRLIRRFRHHVGSADRRSRHVWPRGRVEASRPRGHRTASAPGCPSKTGIIPLPRVIERRVGDALDPRDNNSAAREPGRSVNGELGGEIADKARGNVEPRTNDGVVEGMPSLPYRAHLHEQWSSAEDRGDRQRALPRGRWVDRDGRRVPQRALAQTVVFGRFSCWAPSWMGPRGQVATAAVRMARPHAVVHMVGATGGRAGASGTRRAVCNTNSPSRGRPPPQAPWRGCSLALRTNDLTAAVAQLEARQLSCPAAVASSDRGVTPAGGSFAATTAALTGPDERDAGPVG